MSSSEIEWTYSRVAPDLKLREVHIWRINLVCAESKCLALDALLSVDEKLRAERFHFKRDRIRYITTRATLRSILSKYLKMSPDQLCFCYGNQGKPSIAPISADRSLNFNLSHSGDLAIIAVSWNRNLGIDIERVRTDVRHEEIAQSYFSAAEFRSLAGLLPEDRKGGFFDCWTRKEAYIKARGGGLQIPLDSFDVNLEPGTTARFLRGVDPCWHIVAFVAEHGYPAAVVYDGALAEICYFDTDHRGVPDQL